MAKELNKPLTTLIPRKENKRWKLALKRPEKQIRILNDNTEHAYHRIITFVKQQHLKPDEVYFERNYKHDKNEGLYGMHSMVTSTFYWRLDCSENYYYEVEFAFCNCPFEADIRHMLRANPFDTQAKEKVFTDFKAFYERVLTVQDKQFIGTLNSPPNRLRL